MRTFPTKTELYELVKLCKVWATHTLTVSINGEGDWHYQTGDNSYAGPCYFHPVWAVVSLPTIDDEDGEILCSANYNCREVVEEILEQLKDGYWNHVEVSA